MIAGRPPSTGRIRPKQADVYVRGSDTDWRLLAAVESVAGKLGVTMTQVALNWVATQPGVASAIVGASSADQLGANVAALDLELPAELRAELDEASSVPPPSVYRMFTPEYQGRLVSPGVKVGDKPAGYAPAVRNWAPESRG
ncbi:aldo/keto reductase [Nonomuraea helvata]|uniref:aldo/keto reductase n=1 Tax=Nonomuraea helvata TaxID=37484 RepID=UPI0031E937D8